ncbi:MAG: oxidoreductase FAD/NAD(P)-binding domain-containing protein [Halothiobacillaceae bacterium]|nr:MAG: oxidoreductase FAD/NAD(P)-binding domain-containing protein [Halothiobacillaceae bacterium]
MNPYLPHEALIVDRIQESPTIFTLRLQFTDPQLSTCYSFQPGQFNMVYLYGAGEVAISIVSDPENETLYDHTIRIVGRVTRGLAQLNVGERVGIRGPYGRGWPLAAAEGKDVLIVTGGLGCAPVVAVIGYILKRRDRFGRLTIMQGVKHADDLLWQQRYAEWQQLPNTQVIVAADKVGKSWPWLLGRVTDLFDQVKLDPAYTLAMMCGPEGMMGAAVAQLLQRGLSAESIYLSMERNMQCAVGHCGHCQYGGKFICKDGPVFSYNQIKSLFGKAGF